MATDSGGAGDDGLEVPVGLELELRLPASDTPWEPVGSSPELRLTGLDREADGTTARLVAEGMGETVLRFVSGDRHHEVPVTVTAPLMND